MKKWLVWLLFLVGVGLYVPSFKGKFFWDDESFFEKNVYVQKFDVGKMFTESTDSGFGGVSNYYRPLTSLSFAISYQLFGLNPVGWHVTNALLHAGAGVMLFLLLEELVKQTNRQTGKQQKGMARWVGGLMTSGEGLAFWAALIFLVHPVQVEAVAFTNSRGDSLYALLLFAGLYLFTKSIGLKGKGERLKVLVESVVMYGLSILAKEIAVAGIGLYGLVFFVMAKSDKRKVKSWKDVFFKFKGQLRVLGANLLILLTYVYLRATKLNFLHGFDFAPIKDIYSQSLWVRMMTLGRIFWEYMKMLWWPVKLHFGRSAVVETGCNWPLLLLMLLFLAVVLMGWWEWRRFKTMWVGFGLMWFLIIWAPVSGVVVAMNQKVLEHWMYVPMVGLWVAVFSITYQLLRERWLKFLNIVLVGLVVICGYLAVRQMKVWAGPVEFYRYNLKYDQSWGMYQNLCYEQMELNSYADALVNCQEAAKSGHPVAYNTLGGLWERLGDGQKAEENYKLAVEAMPAYYPGWKNLVSLYIGQMRWGEALVAAEKLAELEPDSWEYRLMVGKVDWLSGNETEADKNFERAAEMGDNQEVDRLVEQIKGTNR